MKLVTGFNIKRNKKTVVSDIIKFFEIRGYTLTNANAQGMVFKRGNWWANLTSLNPISWATHVRIDIIKKARMDYDVIATYRFNTLGQLVTQETRHYFQEEVNVFENAIKLLQVNDEKTQTLAQEAVRSAIKTIGISTLIGALMALLLIFFINFIVSGTLSFILRWAIIAISLFLSILVIPRLREHL